MSEDAAWTKPLDLGYEECLSKVGLKVLNSMNRLSGSSATMMFSSTVCLFSGRECWNTMPKPLRAIPDLAT